MMQFWLSFNNFEEKLQLPVNPLKQFKISTSQKNNTIGINGLGDITSIGDEGLAEITPIESFFPMKYEPYCTYRDIPKPMDAVALISKWKSSKRPIRLIVTGMNVNMPVTIEKFEYGVSSGSNDIEYILELKEYRFIEVTQVNDAVEQTIRQTDKVVQNSYTVKSGDTLSAIAKKLTGKSDNWRTIYSANKDIIGKDPGKLLIGQKLVISV